MLAGQTPAGGKRIVFPGSPRPAPAAERTVPRAPKTMVREAIRAVVVGVATLDEADPVLAPAATLARTLDAELHVVHVYGLPEPIQDAYVRQMLLEPAVLDRYGETLRSQLEAQVREHAAWEKVVCHVRSGPVRDGLTAVAAEVGAGLIVVGATRRGRVWRHLLGTAAEGVIRQAAVPVLVLRQPLEREPRHVLFTTDLSELSARVHRQGRELVRALFPAAAPELRSLLVVQYDLGMPLPLRPELLREVAERELAAFFERVGFGDDAATARVRVGEPANEILSEAAEWPADLIVVGTHGRAGVHRFVLGSVAGATLRGTSCNVLVIPGVAAAAGSAAGVPAKATDLQSTPRPIAR